MNEEQIIDQSVLAEDVSSQIPYTFLDFFLVKPLDPVKVKKEFSTPVDTTVKEDDGMKVEEFQEVAKEIKEVDSDYRKGIVLKRPMFFDDPNKENNNLPNINVGDTVIFRDTAGLWFDLLKDSKLLRMYDILGVVK